MAIFAGRAARKQIKKRLQKYPQHKRKAVLATWAGAFTITTGTAFGTYYWINLKPAPITGRMRFLTTSLEDEVKYAEEVNKQYMEQFEGKILLESDPRVARVKNVCFRILNAIGPLEMALEEELDSSHKDLMKWSITVVENEAANAFVLPNGSIFVFSGLLELCDSDRAGESRLAAVLGHEISHALLRHGGERISQSQLLLGAQSLLNFLIWTVVPDGFFDFLHIRTLMGLEAIQRQILDIMTALPNSREQESEADYIGLLLSSAACYDPRQAPVLWDIMAEASESEPLEILSTHPLSKERSANLTEWQIDAMKMRDFCNCGMLDEGGCGSDDTRRNAEEAPTSLYGYYRRVQGIMHHHDDDSSSR
eukprot:CAMPEP_0197519672 /NCGR_PEP_ID=MMETSP1318-20131121/4949_1 /TAXON_ID=552666 /ORGANISM="Partenskyella glossopodia, Strain RCC365" /LENGTH=365 /DNA_ID=CAMNT_0043070799 /DNA_START=167 /DNA_END=1264 /DNA_ORIENTATION=-